MGGTSKLNIIKASSEVRGKGRGIPFYAGFFWGGIEGVANHS